MSKLPICNQRSINAFEGLAEPCQDGLWLRGAVSSCWRSSTRWAPVDVLRTHPVPPRCRAPSMGAQGHASCRESLFLTRLL